MDFQNVSDAINYLRNLDDIVVPSQFTYFNHCTCFQGASIQDALHSRGGWTMLPTREFILNKEMSFTDRNLRINDALGYGTLTEAMIRYKHLPMSKDFIIRVIMPKNNLDEKEKNELSIDYDYNHDLMEIYSGYGDKRHPKLKKGEKIIMFACSSVDEVSGKNIDVFYGLREQDVIMYAKKVYSELSKQNKHPYFEMVKPTKQYDLEFERNTYFIKKAKSFSRYVNRIIIGNNADGPVYGTEFLKDYIYDVQQEVLKEKNKKCKKIEDALGFKIVSYNTVVIGDKLVNVPKTKDVLINEYLKIDYNIEHGYYLESLSFTTEYREYIRKLLKEVYDDMIKNASDSKENESVKSDETVNTSSIPQDISKKGIVRHNVGTKNKDEESKKETDKEEELVNKVMQSQYDEYGVERKRINDELNRIQHHQEMNNRIIRR